MTAEEIQSEKSRPCPICLAATSRDFIFRQEFATFSHNSLLDGYNIVQCLECGCIFADGIPEQSDFDRYYARMSKYAGVPREVDVLRYRDIVSKLIRYTQRGEAMIRDAGCAAGGLLAEFGKHGCKHLFGFDIGRDEMSAEINTLFDLTCCTSVLEHIRDVGPFLSAIKARMAFGSRLYIEVPDVTRYHETNGAGFGLFSMEHINYFSPTSIRLLLERHGFQISYIDQIDRFLSPKSIEPTLSVLAFLPQAKKIYSDDEARKEVGVYIAKSKKKEEAVVEKIGELVRNRTPIAVWGTGTHTLRLLSACGLDKCIIQFFLDTNTNYQGLTLKVGSRQVPIEIPSLTTMRIIEESKIQILISSEVYQDEIEQQLRLDLGYKGKIIKLY
jgi:hypothetical protein